MKIIKKIVVLILFHSCVTTQKIELINFTESDILSIDVVTHKIELRKTGIDKLAKCKIHDVVIVLGVKFNIDSENKSYFPPLPIIFKDDNNKYCYFMIEHLNAEEKKRIYKIFDALTK